MENKLFLQIRQSYWSVSVAKGWERRGEDLCNLG
jgi:hypothetical protein